MKSATSQRQAMIHFICPGCNKKYKITYQKAGTVIGCKLCSKTIVVPVSKDSK